MDTSTKTKAARRKYQRRSDEQRIADLENRIAELKAKAAEREKKTDPVIREIPKVQRRLRKFAQLAMERSRPDIANTTTAFAAALERYPIWSNTRMEHINYSFRMGLHHRFAYDFETLEGLLQRAGFADVKRRAFDPELDSERRRVGTLYVEAVKPNGH